MVKVLYFAWLRERIGASSEDLQIPPNVETVSGLIDWLRDKDERYAAAFADTNAIRVAIDQEQSAFDAPIAGAREIALFPPVTGG